MSLRNSLVICFLIATLQFSFSQNIDKNPPKFNYIEATLWTDGNKLMMMRGAFPDTASSSDTPEPYSMKMWFLASEAEGEQAEPMFFDMYGYIYIKTEEGWIKTYFDTVLFPIIPFLSQADEFKSEIDIELGIDPLPKYWPLLSLVTTYNIGHFEGRDQLAKKETITVDGKAYTKFSAVDPDNLGNSITFDNYGRLYLIITPQGAIEYDYFFSNESLTLDFPFAAKHQPNLGELLTLMLINFLSDFGG